MLLYEHINLSVVTCFIHLYPVHMIKHNLSNNCDINRELICLFVTASLINRRFCWCLVEVNLRLFKTFFMCYFDIGLWRFCSRISVKTCFCMCDAYKDFLWQGWLDIYRRYISLIYIGYISHIFVRKYRIFSIFSIFIEFLKYFLMWHIVTTFWFSARVFCWLMTCALSIFSVLDNFCQIAPLHSNAVWMTRVLHLICNAHTHTIIW